MSVDVDKLLALCEAATPGPWKISNGIGVHYLSAGQPQPVAKLYDKSGGETNAAFIAAARVALPELLAEVVRLRKECQQHANNAGEYWRENCEAAKREWSLSDAQADEAIALAEAITVLKADRKRDAEKIVELERENDVHREALARFDAGVEARAKARTADVETQTVERIAAWLDEEAKFLGQQENPYRSPIYSDRIDSMQACAADIRSGAWRKP